MKRLVVLLVAGIVLGFATAKLCAQDPLAAAPDMYRLLFENERVRVMEVTFQPGQKIAPHSHPDHFVYVVEGGQVRITTQDGTSTDADLQADQVVWMSAVTHWAENTGTSVVRLVVTELKEPAPAAAAAATAPAEEVPAEVPADAPASGDPAPAE